VIYSQLVSTVGGALGRSDADDFIPRFIEMAEGEINRRLDVREMTDYTTLTISSEAVSVPCGFAGVKSFRLVTTPVQKLEYVRPDAFDAYWDSARTGTGTPTSYTIVGDQFLFWPVASTAQTARLRYRKRLDGLSTANFSNFVSEHYPDLYVYGVLKHAALFVGDERAGVWSQQFERALDETQADSLRQNAGSTMQMQSQAGGYA
jgi:hypothetical protein